METTYHPGQRKWLNDEEWHQAKRDSMAEKDRVVSEFVAACDRAVEKREAVRPVKLAALEKAREARSRKSVERAAWREEVKKEREREESLDPVLKAKREAMRERMKKAREARNGKG